MNEGVGIGPGHLEEKIAVSEKRRRFGRRRRDRGNGVARRRPQRPVSRHDRRLGEQPRKRGAALLGKPVSHHREADVSTGRKTSHRLLGVGAELSVQDRVDVFATDAAPFHLTAVAFLGEKRLATEAPSRLDDGVLERQMLERVERIVMDERRDRTLSR